jgi:serine/threonine protein kinase
MTDTVTSQSIASENLDRSSLCQSQSNSDRNILAGRYQLQSILSRSNFGITWLAQNIYLPGQPWCIVKQLAPRSADPLLVEIAHQRFALEALSLSQLGSHAQIPTLLDYFQIDDNFYLVAEYIPGTVLTRIVQQQPFTGAEVEKFLTEMLQLLEYIHSQQLIHCDIKPENIILCQTDRRMVLVDFGAVVDLNLATTVRERADTSSVAVGTPGFAPPEQLANRAVYASDLYALGMTCIYLLTGKEPSQFATDPRTCELLWTDNLDISEGLSQIISKTIQISLSDRYQSAVQVLTALETRSIRATLRTYVDQKYAVANSQQIGLRSYPAVINWALGIE